MADKTLRLVLGDQLNHEHSWWKDAPESFEVLMVESRSETDYALHHIQKVIAFFMAMRSFAEWLQKRGFTVHYIRLDEGKNAGSLAENIREYLGTGRYSSWEYQLPDEYRLDKVLSELLQASKVPGSCCDTEHFLSERLELQEFFEGKKSYLMESFYRMMRRKYDLLMNGDAPEGGRWNYDKSNRKSIPGSLTIPAPKLYSHDVASIYRMIEKAGVRTIGSVDPEKFIWPYTRRQALSCLRFFIDECLEKFGDYQDAMEQDQWSLFHSRLSFALNVKLLHPLEVVQAVIDAWQGDKERYPLAAVEGFTRQIIGWREYMRGVYWAQMPGYARKNFFRHQRDLPSWYWDGQTRMNCMQQAISQSLEYAYAHHIQRLMLTGSFALLYGAHPDAVDQWYLGIYIDALEWVEITNTRGMSQYADAGLVGTKPYVSTANYIDKMSNYCGNCYYDKNKPSGEKACPFNSLYWDFYERHRDKLQGNQRIGFVYPTLDKMKPDKKKALLDQAAHYIKNVDKL